MGIFCSTGLRLWASHRTGLYKPAGIRMLLLSLEHKTLLVLLLCAAEGSSAAPLFSGQCVQFVKACSLFVPRRRTDFFFFLFQPQPLQDCCGSVVNLSSRCCPSCCCFYRVMLFWKNMLEKENRPSEE